MIELRQVDLNYFGWCIPIPITFVKTGFFVVQIFAGHYWLKQLSVFIMCRVQKEDTYVVGTFRQQFISTTKCSLMTTGQATLIL